jgi:hypothetical protein
MLLYKSTAEALKAHAGRELYLLEPPDLVEGGRLIYVMAGLLDILSDVSDTHDGRRHIALRDFLDGFSLGDPITVCEHPYAKPAGVMLSRVDPVGEELWSFRCFDHADGTRVLGRFVAKDCFVALDWDYRKNLDEDDTWAGIRDECRSAWLSLFGNLQPHQGSNVHDYLSSNFTVVSADRRRKGARRNV